MALMMPDIAIMDGLGYLTNKYQPENLILRLYVNDIVPAESDTADTYTEAVGSGYVPMTMTGEDWTVLDTSPPAVTGAQQVFTFSGAMGNVYGYFLTRDISGAIAWAERFGDGPYNVARNGDEIRVTPRLDWRTRKHRRGKDGP